MTSPPLPALQRQSEIIRFLDLITKTGCKTGIEVGCAGCGTASLISEAMGEGSLLVSVDLPEADGGTPAVYEQMCREHLSPGCEWTLVRGRSVEPATLDAVKASLNGRKADMVFIDAEHTPEAAMAEYEAYRRFLTGRGFVSFHDICMPQLWPMWCELRGRFPHGQSSQIIEDPSQTDSGIGIIAGVA